MDSSSKQINILHFVFIRLKIRFNHPDTPILLVGTKLDLAGQPEEIRKARQMGRGVVTFRQVSTGVLIRVLYLLTVYFIYTTGS